MRERLRSAAPFIFLLITLWESLILLITAGRKRFWFDELLTLHVSGLPRFSDVLRALREGVDGMSPSYLAIMRVARRLPGDPHVTLRWPSLAGYLLTLAAVWFFLRYRSTATAAVTGVLIVCLSPFRTYAIEARPYALMTGLVACAAACWQRIGEKRWASPLFGLALLLAVSTHHFAVVLIGPFAAAEGIYFLRTRKVRAAVWISCAISLFPFVSSLPLLLGFSGTYGTSYWSRATWLSAFQTYGPYLDMELKPALVLVTFVGLTALLALVSRRGWATGDEDQNGFLPEEVALMLALLIYPAFLAVLTKIAGTGYVPRYGWPGIIGIAAGLVCSMRVKWPASGCLAAALLAAFLYQAGGDIRNMPSENASSLDTRWARLEAQCRSIPDAPVVIGSGLSFLEAVEYSRPSLRNRLVQPVDPAEAVRIIQTDSVDETLIRYARFFPVHVVDRALFESSHRSFFLYSGGAYDWFTRYATVKGYTLRLLWSDTTNALYLATPAV